MDMMEEPRANPSGKLFDWKNQRLQAAISGQRAMSVRKRLAPGRLMKLMRVRLMYAFKNSKIFVCLNEENLPEK